MSTGRPEAAAFAASGHESVLSPFLTYVWSGQIKEAQAMLNVDRELLDYINPTTGLTALHIAVGRDDLAMTKMLVEAGAKFIPDGLGRMPSMVAAELEVGEALQDFIVEAEAKALETDKSEDV